MVNLAYTKPCMQGHRTAIAVPQKIVVQVTLMGAHQHQKCSANSQRHSLLDMAPLSSYTAHCPPSTQCVVRTYYAQHSHAHGSGCNHWAISWLQWRMARRMVMTCLGCTALPGIMPSSPDHCKQCHHRKSLNHLHSYLSHKLLLQHNQNAAHAQHKTPHKTMWPLLSPFAA